MELTPVRTSNMEGEGQSGALHPLHPGKVKDESKKASDNGNALAIQAGKSRVLCFSAFSLCIVLGRVIEVRRANVSCGNSNVVLYGEKQVQQKAI